MRCGKKFSKFRCSIAIVIIFSRKQNKNFKTNDDYGQTDSVFALNSIKKIYFDVFHCVCSSNFYIISPIILYYN